MKKFVLTLCLVALTFSWCSAQYGLTTEERESIKETVKNQSQEFWDLLTHDYTDENLKRVLGILLEADDEAWMGEPTLWIGGNSIYYTKDEIKQGFEWFFEGALIPGETSSQLTVTAQGNYSVTATIIATTCNYTQDAIIYPSGPPQVLDVVVITDPFSENHVYGHCSAGCLHMSGQSGQPRF